MPLRDLPRELVPTPDQLLEKLSSLQGVQLPKSSNQQLMELGQQMLKGMSDEQRAFFQELANDVNQGREPPIPPELRNLAEELQQDMFKEDLPLDMQELLREFSNQNNSPPSNSEAPVQNPGSSEKLRPRSNNDRSKPKQKLESANRLLDAFKRRSSSDDLGPQSGPLKFPEASAENLADQFSRSIQESTDKETFAPDPTWFEPGQESNGGPRESVGNRFDRMILKAVNNQLNETGESRSELADSVEGLFSGALERVHRALNGRDWTSQDSTVSSRTKPMSSNRQSKSVWSRVSSGVGGGGFEIGSSFVTWLVWAGGLGLVMVLAGFGIRWWFQQNNRGQGPRRRTSPVKFKDSKIGTGTDLIRATDQLVLSRFGPLSRWWHARRAELALSDEVPALQNDIKKLVEHYEFARYSDVEQGLSDQELTDCRSILATLARHPIRRQTAQESDEAK